VTFTVYGQPLPPNRCDIHPEQIVGPFEVCKRCGDDALGHALSMAEERRWELRQDDEYGEAIEGWDE
jgi:hypothetical protein